MSTQTSSVNGKTIYLEGKIKQGRLAVYLTPQTAGGVLLRGEVVGLLQRLVELLLLRLAGGEGGLPPAPDRRGGVLPLAAAAGFDGHLADFASVFYAILVLLHPFFYAILVILHPYFRRDARSASSSVPFARKSRLKSGCKITKIA